MLGRGHSYRGYCSCVEEIIGRFTLSIMNFASSRKNYHFSYHNVSCILAEFHCVSFSIADQCVDLI